MTVESQLQQQAVPDDLDARTGLAPVIPLLPAAHQRLAMLRPGDRRRDSRHRRGFGTRRSGVAPRVTESWLLGSSGEPAAS